ncbi:MAG: M48 family metallopeptidase, partial [Nitrospirae bacterium]|nr:M48 family metallopeptidase [Nitrospirota bacterium]
GLLEKHRNLIDYVVLHELLHMKVPNHGKLFKSLMFAYLPDWEKYREQLTPLEKQ